MTSYFCQLRPYGIIMKADLVRLSKQIDRMLFFPAKLDDLLKGGVISSLGRTRSTRKLPDDVIVALAQAGIYWTWESRESGTNHETTAGLYFDAEAGMSVRYRYRSGTCILDPMPLGQRRFPYRQAILDRMLAVQKPQPLLVASSHHEALRLIRHPDLDPGLGQHCLCQRSQVRGLGMLERSA